MHLNEETGTYKQVGECVRLVYIATSMHILNKRDVSRNAFLWSETNILQTLLACRRKVNDVTEGNSVEGFKKVILQSAARPGFMFVCHMQLI